MNPPMNTMTFETWFGQLHPQISIRSVQAVLHLIALSLRVPAGLRDQLKGKK